MKAKFNLLFTFVAALLVISCNKKNDAPLGAYQSGVLVVNQGQFQHANGDVTYYNPTTGVIEQNIYNAVNENGTTTFAGNDLQSLTVDGDNGYLVNSGGGAIPIVNVNTFKLSSTFTHSLLVNPRYLAVINGNAYVSTWGGYDANYNLTKSYVLVFNTKTLQYVDTIGTDLGAETVLYNGKYLFVSNNNYGASNTVSVIDPSQDKQINKITLSTGGPASLVLDVNNKLWVIANGTETNYVGNNDGALYRINPSTFAIEQTINLNTNPGNCLVTSPDKKTLYYIANNSVYQIGIDATTAPTSALITNSDFVSLSWLGVDNSGDVYVADATSYTSPGTAYIYSAAGTEKSQITAGIDPIQFIFR